MEQQEIEQFRDQVKQLTESLQRLNEGVDGSKNTISDALGKKLPNAAKPTIEGLKGLGSAASDVTAALYRGERGLGVMVKGVDTLADSLQAAIAVFTLFTPMGKALSLTSKILLNGGAALAKGMSSFQKLTAEQSDKLFKTYQELSKIGAVGAGGLESLNDSLMRAGFSIAELEKFATVIKKNAADLTLLGATAQSGATRLTEISGAIVKSDLGRSLEMLGYTAADLANSTATYINLQTRLGRVQNKTTAELAFEGAKFALELDKMARLTGQSREEQEKNRKSLIGDERYAAFLGGEARERNLDINALESFLATIADPEVRKGLQHLIAGRGAATSEEARRVFMSDPRAYERAMAVAERRATPIQAAQEFAGALGQYQRTFQGLTQFTGTGPGVAMGGEAGTLMFSERLKAMEEAAAKAGMTLDQFARSEQLMAEFDKGDLKVQVDTRRNQMNINQALDATVHSFRDLNKTTAGLTSAFDKLMKAAPTPAGGAATTGTAGLASAQGLASLREMIASGESRGNYNVMVGGQTADLTNMTIAQVIDLQKKRAAGGQGTAAGKYQIINKTLEGLVREGNIDTNAKFDQGMQDRLADMLIRKRGLTDYQTGKISKEQFARNLSQEWAALPSSAGSQSYYAGVGNNKAGLSWDQVMQNLNSVPVGPAGQYGARGSLAGPTGSYSPNNLPGVEATNRPSSVDPQAQNRDASSMIMIEKLDNLIDINRAQLATSQRILKYQQ